ncbi:MAG: hypothetical protein LQ347_005435 [Umbilicaria vellea]|nr:MAG: hypothetical protein LQ347_005435 [Umbilicaria vellea]
MSIKSSTSTDHLNGIPSDEAASATSASTDRGRQATPTMPSPNMEAQLRRKVDRRLCTIAAILCSLDLLDSGVISSASVTSMVEDLDLRGNRYSVAIFIFTVASVTFQLPSTICVRLCGPRIWFAGITLTFGVITLLRFAYLQSGQVFILATGGIVNFGVAIMMGIIAYWWMVDFPENAHRSFRFLNKNETDLAVARIQKDRGDVELTPFSCTEVLRNFLDPKIYAFAVMFFLLNLVSTALSYFLPIILQSGMGFTSNQAILLSAPVSVVKTILGAFTDSTEPFYYAVVPALISSRIGDKYRLRGPVISFNSLCLIVGFAMLGFSNQVTVRYVGTFLATGAYVSNWAALNSYQANNITGSHVLMIGFVLAFSAYFYSANKKQAKGKKVIEETDGFRFTY